MRNSIYPKSLNPGDQVPASRLRVETRVLCLLGPITAVLIFVGARFVVPFVWQQPSLAAAVSRPCVFRTVTGFPCPFCGGTRSVVLAARGEWASSLQMSPFGIPLVAGSVAVGFWLLLCALTGYDLGLAATSKMITRLARPAWLAGALAALWAWKLVS